MKKVAFLFIIAIQFCNAQYVSMLDTTLVWHESIIGGAHNNTFTYCGMYWLRDVFEEDGVFKAKVCDNDNYCGISLEEDSLHRIYYTGNDGARKLLYDFGAQPGDTVFFPVGGALPDSGFAIVDSITLYPNRGIDYTQHSVSYYSRTGVFCRVGRWIEGIGSFNGFLNGAEREWITLLESVTRNNTLIFGWPGCFTDVTETNSLVVNFFQANRLINIISNEPLITALYDINGRLLCSYSTNRFEIDNRYYSGPYLLHIYQQGKPFSSVYKRIIIY
jgi:hypothetical protein